MPTILDHPDLFLGVKAIEDAGGVDAFIEALRAEHHVVAKERIHREKIMQGQEWKVGAICGLVLNELIERHILPDVARELRACGGEKELEDAVRDRYDDIADTLRTLCFLH